MHLKKSHIIILILAAVVLISGCAKTETETDIKAKTKAKITTVCKSTGNPPPCPSGDVEITPSPTSTLTIIPGGSPTTSPTTLKSLVEFWPAGDLWIKSTLDGDDQEFNKIFLKYGSGDGAFLIYDPIPQGYETDIGGDFILTTTQGKTYRLRTSSPGFTGKSVTLKDQYGATYKAELQRAGEGVPPCHTPYSGTLKIDGESYSILYKDSGCISDSGFSTIDQLKIGEEKTGPIKYNMKNNIQIELSSNSKLKNGPFATQPTEPIVFYVKSGGNVLFEISFKFGGNGVLNVVDKDTSDNFVSKESELIVGGYQILSAS